MITYTERSLRIILILFLCLGQIFPAQSQESISLISPEVDAEFRVEYTDEIHFAWRQLEVSGEVEYRLLIAKYHEEEDYNEALLHGEQVFEYSTLNETEVSFPLQELPLSVGNLYVWTIMANHTGSGEEESSNHLMAPARALLLSHSIIRDEDGTVVYYESSEEIGDETGGDGGADGQPASSCSNGKFELNSFANWTGKYGTYFNVTQNGLIPNRHQLISSPGSDPHIPSIPLLPAGGGNVTVRLGNDAAGRQSESLTYAFTVNNLNQDFLYRYAVVLEEPGWQHQPNERPYFEVEIYEMVGNSRIVHYSLYNYADPNNPYFKTANSAYNSRPIVYRNWTCESVDLSAHLGKNLFIEFTTADCDLSGHFGYAYIDGVCLLPASVTAQANLNLPPTNLFCGNEPVIIDATVTNSVTDYTVCIQQWANNSPAGPEYCQSFFGAPGNINVGSILQSNNAQFNCNSSYRITLEGWNACSPPSVVQDFFFILCPPPVDAGPDITFCAGNGAPTIGPASSSSSYTYSWSPATGLSDPNIANPQVLTTNPSQTTYTLTRTDVSHGCSVTDQVTVTVFDAGSVSLTGDLCNIQAQINSSPYAPTPTISWSTGQTGVTTIPTSNLLSGNITYTATVEYYDPYHNTTCAATGSIVIYSHPTFHWPLPGLAIPNAMTPNGDGLNDTWFVGAVNPQWNPGDPYYGATAYQLQIFDRWGNGNVIYDTNIVTTTTGFGVFEIEWDATDIGGSPVQEGVYPYTVKLWNCQDYHSRTGTITVIR